MEKLKYKIYNYHVYISDEKHERRRQKYLRRYYFKHPEARIKKCEEMSPGVVSKAHELFSNPRATGSSFLQGPVRGAIHMREE